MVYVHVYSGLRGSLRTQSVKRSRTQLRDIPKVHQPAPLFAVKTATTWQATASMRYPHAEHTCLWAGFDTCFWAGISITA